MSNIENPFDDIGPDTIDTDSIRVYCDIYPAFNRLIDGDLSFVMLKNPYLGQTKLYMNETAAKAFLNLTLIKTGHFMINNVFPGGI